MRENDFYCVVNYFDLLYIVMMIRVIIRILSFVDVIVGNSFFYLIFLIIILLRFMFYYGFYKYRYGKCCWG